jgi:CBS domain-containing protein
MSKTARDVMTAGDSWPEAPDDRQAELESVAGRPGQLDRSTMSHTIGADDWVDAALATMTELKVRRLPVVDRGRLVGTISQGDLASSIEQAETWSLLCK